MDLAHQEMCHAKVGKGGITMSILNSIVIASTKCESPVFMHDMSLFDEINIAAITN